MRVRWVSSAVLTLRNSLRHIHDENPFVAQDCARRIKLAVERLEPFPLSGRRGTVEGTRELVTPGLPFIIVYRVTESEVQILRVFHSRQALQ